MSCFQAILGVFGAHARFWSLDKQGQTASAELAAPCIIHTISVSGMCIGIFSTEHPEYAL